MTEHVRQLERALEASTSRVDELCAENEKLRRLIRDMWLDMQKQLTPLWLGEYEQRMHLFGIEISDERC